MFSTENAMQAAVHEHPELVLSGIPEINPEYCPDAPTLVSLGREIQLASGPIDNLFIDINAVLTFVECKRYSDGRLKREVYPQALNYASDLQSHLRNFVGADFQREFFQLVSAGQSTPHGSLDNLIDTLARDPVIEGKKLREWRRQFRERLEHNVKSGACRIVLLCAPAPNSVFHYRGIRNLMQLMSFSEQPTARYDLVLMDLREERDAMLSRIIWRRYAALPQIPLVAESSRDTSNGIDRMHERTSRLAPEQQAALQDLLNALSKQGLIAVENTQGYALKSADTKKSLYTQISVGDGGWALIRHQIRPPEPLYEQLEAGEVPQTFTGLDPSVRTKSSSLGTGKLYEVEFAPVPSGHMDDLVRAIIKLAKSE